MKNKTRLEQWMQTVCAFRGIGFPQAAEEIGIQYELMRRRALGFTRISRDEAETIARWGAAFGSPTAAEVWAWSEDKPLPPNEFFEAFRPPLSDKLERLIRERI